MIIVVEQRIKEICLLDQVYVQDSDLTVAKYIDQVAKANNAKITVNNSFVLRQEKGLRRRAKTLLLK